MKHFFTLDGKSSVDFDTWIANGNMWDGAEHDDEAVEVPGRNGAIIFNNGRYRNFSAVLSCYIPSDMQRNVDGLRAFLSSRHGYCKYEDNLHPMEYRMVRYKGGFSLSAADRVGASVDLTFDCKPQRFLKSGDITVTYTGNGTIFNHTNYAARPLIRCVGTGGTVAIGGVSVTVTGCTSSVTIDCDLMEAYEGTVSRNGTTTLNNGAFPTIKPGEWTVTFTGFTRVEITPRWWTI